MVHFCLNSLPSRSVAVLFSERNLNWSASISRAGSFRPTFFRKERSKLIEKMGTMEREVVFEVEIVSAGRKKNWQHIAVRLDSTQSQFWFTEFLCHLGKCRNLIRNNLQPPCYGPHSSFGSSPWVRIPLYLLPLATKRQLSLLKPLYKEATSMILSFNHIFE